VGLESFDRVCEAIGALFRGKGLDLAFGSRLPPLFQKCRLADVSVETDAPLTSGGSGMACMMKMSTEQLSADYIATGCVDANDIQRYCRFVEEGSSSALYYGAVAVSGRTPFDKS